ncbi:hypothetical protein ACFQH2_18065 [Natronoarchaeum sp. GCM10025703]|uniref:hypothetical protein n=1 Tax=unclassified Natronoarchaeum TaxID=2620183 RepID=UPI00360851C5
MLVAAVAGLPTGLATGEHPATDLPWVAVRDTQRAYIQQQGETFYDGSLVE